MRPEPLTVVPLFREFHVNYKHAPVDFDDFDERDDRDDRTEAKTGSHVKQDEPGRFIWETEGGELLYLSEMATRHLFYTLRMLFNHSVPPAFRVGWCPKNRHDNVFDWPADYREQAIRKIYHELIAHRDDLDSDLQEELDDMQQNATAIVALGI